METPERLTEPSGIPLPQQLGMPLIAVKRQHGVTQALHHCRDDCVGQGDFLVGEALQTFEYCVSIFGRRRRYSPFA